MLKRKLIWAYILVLSMLLLVVLLPIFQSWMLDSGYHGRRVDEPAAEFQLNTVNGPSVSLIDLRGKTLLLYFGYLHCDGFCQNQWVTLFHVMQALKEEPVKAVLISLDPQRDDAEAFATLAANLGENFIAITGKNLVEI